MFVGRTMQEQLSRVKQDARTEEQFSIKGKLIRVRLHSIPLLLTFTTGEAGE